MKNKEACAASWWLKWAAIGFVLRAAISPWYVRYFGDHLSKTQPSDMYLVKSSLAGVALFGITAIIARFKPVFACFIALVGFIGMCWIDFHKTPDLFEAGLTGKVVFGCIAVWATMNAIFSRTL